MQYSLARPSLVISHSSMALSAVIVSLFCDLGLAIRDTVGFDTVDWFDDPGFVLPYLCNLMVLYIVRYCKKLLLLLLCYVCLLKRRAFFSFFCFNSQKLRK